MSDVERIAVGLMSGTSLDGVDAVVARLRGQGRAMQIEQLGFAHSPYPDALRELVLEQSHEATSSVRALSQLNVRLADEYAGAVRSVVAQAGLDLADVDVVGCHGQTVHHVPEPDACAEVPTTSTLQLGSASVLANRIGRPVVGDFRLADMALGGQGAPLVPYFDYVCFADERETRLLLNLGGIANLTLLPAGGGPEAVVAFDTGPANMLTDALAQRHLQTDYDAGGAHAAAGSVDEVLLRQLMQDHYFRRTPPKSTGRERFGAAFVDGFEEVADERTLSVADRFATAAALTARSVAEGYRRFVAEEHTADRIWVSGGGVHNEAIMQMLREEFASLPVERLPRDHFEPDAKEALCFAVLAHATLDGVPTGMPSVTGASRPAVLGVVARP